MTESRLHHYIHLTRLHKPIGTILLLWPALWGLWIAAGGFPDIKILLIFIAGGFVMRAAGCAINDFADRHFDAHVERTNYRPVATGKIRPWEALAIFILLSLVGFGLVLLTNPLTIALSVAGAGIIAMYPFMKRYTHWPQLVLGLAWGWSLPMAFAAQSNSLPPNLWLLVAAVVCWTIVFDTYYAMVDRDDDLKIGIKSTAILFGDRDRRIIGLFQAMTVIFLALGGVSFHLGPVYYLGVTSVAAIFAYQQIITRDRDRTACFNAFMNNRWIGLIVFIAVVADSLLKS
jgi:4-hydroxybenzoate polyprenyltransferase